jgi:Protein of unknown function (DUF3833)
MTVRRCLRLTLVAPLALALPGCVSAPPLETPVPPAEAPRFDPFAFFIGASTGEGTLAKVMADPVAVRVESRGRIETEARREAGWAAPPVRVLVLDQVVHEGDKPARQRQWRLTEIAPGRYEGTLSDAIGPVTGRSEGNRLTLDFAIKGGFKVHQELTLTPDAAGAANVLRVSQLGMTVAVLTETIRKTP